MTKRVTSRKPRHSRKDKQAFATQMRAHPSPPEAIMWKYLARSQCGAYFVRQKVILGYIADFYCPRLRLVIEVDGAQHMTPDAIAYDKVRDVAMRQAGYRIIRIPASEVFARAAVVASAIRRRVAELLQSDKVSKPSCAKSGISSTPPRSRGSR